MNRFWIILICLLSLVSCKTKYIETKVPEIHTQYITKENKDTIILRDSVYTQDSIFLYQKNDTIYVNKVKTLIKYKNNYITKNKVDTIHKTDSISIPYKVETIKYVNCVNTLQRVLIYIGLLSLVLIAFYVVIRLYKK